MVIFKWHVINFNIKNWKIKSKVLDPFWNWSPKIKSKVPDPFWNWSLKIKTPYFDAKSKTETRKRERNEICPKPLATHSLHSHWARKGKRHIWIKNKVDPKVNHMTKDVLVNLVYWIYLWLYKYIHLSNIFA